MSSMNVSSISTVLVFLRFQKCLVSSIARTLLNKPGLEVVNGFIIKAVINARAIFPTWEKLARLYFPKGNSISDSFFRGIS